MQLTGLGIENFRIFKDYTEFDFAPITILTGTNSSGKSSLFKALLLLADNAQRNGLSELDFTGEGHQLGTFETVKTKGSEKEEMTFVLRFSGVKDVLFGLLENGYYLKYTFKNGILYKFNLSIYLNAKVEYLYQFVDNKQKYTEKSIDLDLFINAYNERINLEKPKAGSGKDLLIKTSGVSTEILNLNELKKQLVSFDTESVGNFLNSLNENAKSYYIYHADVRRYDKKLHYNLDLFPQGNDKFYIVHDAYPIPNDDLDDTINSETEWEIADEYIYIQKLLDDNFIEEHKDYFNVIGNQVTVSSLLCENFKDFISKVLIDELNTTSKLISSHLELEYLEAVRANTRRIYAFRSEGTTFNELLHQFTKHFSNTENQYIRFLNTWLAKFKIAQEIKLVNVEGAAYKVVLLRANGEEVNLADVGYGMTQVLPIFMRIILFANTFPNGNLFLLEEPETNLHPKMQSLLADFLVDVARKFPITLLVETHSEYLIRKLQYLTAKKEIKPEDTAIYYFYDPENVPAGKKQVERIRIETDGRLDNDFGTGFFDEATTWMMELYKINNPN